MEPGLSECLASEFFVLVWSFCFVFLLLFLFLPIVPHPQLYLLKLNYKAVLRVECLVEIQVLEAGGTGSLQASHSVNPLLPPKASPLTLARQNTQPLTPIQVAASRLVSRAPHPTPLTETSHSTLHPNAAIFLRPAELQYSTFWAHI